LATEFLDSEKVISLESVFTPFSSRVQETYLTRWDLLYFGNDKRGATDKTLYVDK